jgi:predicted phosphate transport protein (TIGR00153 family)
MSVLDRFQESPFGPLGEHMAKVRECVALVEPIFDCVAREDQDELKRLSEQVFKLEHQADEIKTEIRRRIPRSFYLPIFRGDLLAYLKLQDDVADSVEDVAVGLTIKQLSLPPTLAEDVREYVQRVMRVCELLFECSDQLKDLVEQDFGGPRVKAILELVEQAEHAEWEADKVQYRLARKLYALDDELRATDIMLWSNVFRELGRLANHADKSAERLRRMLLT